MALNPNKLYDVVAINASLSTQLGGLPFSGPIGGVRVALIGDRWIGFPTSTSFKGHFRHGGRRASHPYWRRGHCHGRGRVHRAHLESREGR